MRYYLLLGCLTLTICLQAQYSYISDRRFFEPNDLIGYDFKPGGMEIPEEMQTDLDPGQYSFGITSNHLYVKGQDLEGVYNINNIQPADYGFKLLLMNARDARLQGHLKVILNKYSMVEALIFKRSSGEKEIIFYLLPITGKQQAEEKDYFTDRGELIIEHTDSLWGKTIYPFLIIHEDQKVQQRLAMRDSTRILFTKEISVEEKERNKRRKDKSEEDGEETVVIDSIAVEGLPDSTGLDDPDRKVKITTEYFITIYSIVEYNDGTKEKEEWKFPVKKINEREDESAGMQEERYQWELVNDKKEEIYLYLNGDHTVSTLEVGQKRYLMRGF